MSDIGKNITKKRINNINICTEISILNNPKKMNSRLNSLYPSRITFIEHNFRSKLILNTSNILNNKKNINQKKNFIRKINLKQNKQNNNSEKHLSANSLSFYYRIPSINQNLTTMNRYNNNDLNFETSKLPQTDRAVVETIRSKIKSNNLLYENINTQRLLTIIPHKKSLYCKKQKNEDNDNSIKFRSFINDINKKSSRKRKIFPKISYGENSSLFLINLLNNTDKKNKARKLSKNNLNLSRNDKIIKCLHTNISYLTFRKKSGSKKVEKDEKESYDNCRLNTDTNSTNLKMRINNPFRLRKKLLLTKSGDIKNIKKIIYKNDSNFKTQQKSLASNFLYSTKKITNKKKLVDYKKIIKDTKVDTKLKNIDFDKSNKLNTCQNSPLQKRISILNNDTIDDINNNKNKSNNKKKIIIENTNTINKSKVKNMLQNYLKINTSSINSKKKISFNSKKNNLNTLKAFPIITHLNRSKIALNIIPKSQPYQTKIITDIEIINKKGFYILGPKKQNQDNFFIYKNINNSNKFTYFGVCDGHGAFGAEVSKYLIENLPLNINKNILLNKITYLSFEPINNLSKIFINTFLQTNNELKNNKKIDISLSGSTCTSILFTPRRLISINLGDSRSILGKYNEKKWFSKNLSIDHKPGNINEKKRIIENGGIVDFGKNDMGTESGPERVWVKNGYLPGLAMSRSFGDEIAHEIGVISEPEVKEYLLLEEDKFFVLASDGLWEYISNDEVVGFVKEFYEKKDAKGAVKFLYKEAAKRWMKDADVVDDITIIVVFMN